MADWNKRAEAMLKYLEIPYEDYHTEAFVRRHLPLYEMLYPKGAYHEEVPSETAPAH